MSSEECTENEQEVNSMSQNSGRKYDNVAAIDLLHQVSSMYSGTKKPHDYGTGETFTSVETHIVKCIADHPGITVTELAYDYAKTKGAISQILKKLIEKGIILQKPSPEQGDKRIFLFLTPAGEKLNEAHVRYDEFHAGETLDRVRLEFTDEQFDTAFDVIQCWLKCRRIVHEERRLAREGRQKED